jgi:hypothetical protein
MPTHTESITADSLTYSIRMGGTLDGLNTRDPIGGSSYEQAFEPNISVRMENIGDTDVVNPWIIVNGKRDWRSLDHILDGVLQDEMSDREKARAIWEFARTHRYHFTCADDEVKDTVKMLNVYGYTLCWDEAYTLSNLWQAAGLKVRRGYPHGHCTTEVWYEEAFHLLDSDEHLLYLLRDNETVAGETDLARDHDLVKRGHSDSILQEESVQSAEATASLFVPTAYRVGGRPRIGNHSMNVVLRPGEALVWGWQDLGKYHGYWDRPKRMCNGRMEYVPDLAKANTWANRAEGWARGIGGLRPEEAGGTASLEMTIACPYVVVGGKVDLAFDCEPAEGIDVSVSRDGDDWSVLPCSDTAGIEKSLSLDTFFCPDGPAAYSYLVRICAVGGDRSVMWVLKHLSITTDLQMAPLSLPALEVGDNSISYSSAAEGRVEVTHVWEERGTDLPLDPPREPGFPVHEQEVIGTEFTFTWPEVEGAANYHFQLGDREDMKYRLSPVFEKLVSRTPALGSAEWRIPVTGLLNPNETYYWRVRARSGEGLWGAWSPTWSFVPRAPGVPVAVQLDVDREGRTLALNWQANPNGNRALRYEVYGSDERGFSVSREPYEVLTANSKSEMFQPNLIATTDETWLLVAGPEAGTPPFATYRVVAIDAAGARSGASDFAEAPRPMIVSSPDSIAVAGQAYNYQIRATASIGDLRCERVGRQNYLKAFRDGDVLRFLLDEGPDWIDLDEHTGLLTARPQSKDVSIHTVTVRVQNGQGGTDMQGFDLRVIA